MSNGKKGSGDLESAYERNSKWADRIARLIIVGLAVEIAAVFILHKPPLEAALSITSTVLIVAGVWGELIFEKRAKAAADGIVAQANARAAEAELQTERIRARMAPRRIDSRAFRLKMKDVPASQAEILFLQDDGEAWQLGMQLAPCLHGLGWHAKGPLPIPKGTAPFDVAPSQIAIGGQASGISIVTRLSDSAKLGDDFPPFMPVAMPPAAKALITALREQFEGITAAMIRDTPPLNAPAVGVVRIVIGPKP